MKKLLLLEDDAGLADGLCYILEREGYRVEAVKTVREAKEVLLRRAGDYDLLLLDVVCEQVRASGSRIPILFLTAADEELQIIRGLDSGGDDYLTKPFRMGELCSRIRALLRRGSIQKDESSSEILSDGSLTVHTVQNRVWKDGALLSLTATEYRLLCLFLRKRGHILTREVIQNELWDGCGDYVDDNTLSVHIRRLREKVEEDASHPVRLRTVRGFGYEWRKN